MGTLYEDIYVKIGNKSIGKKFMEKQPEFLLKALFWPIFLPYEMLENLLEYLLNKNNIHGLLYPLFCCVLVIFTFIAYRIS